MWEVHELYVSVLNKMKRFRQHGIEVNERTVFDVLQSPSPSVSAQPAAAHCIYTGPL